VLATTRFQGAAWRYHAENDDDDDDDNNNNNNKLKYQYKNIAFELLTGINKNYKHCIGEQGNCQPSVNSITTQQT
jgi:hypothetical protein